MSSALPPHLLRLFAPRPPIGTAIHTTRRKPNYTGLSTVLDQIKDFDSDYVPTETVSQIKRRLKAQREAQTKENLAGGIEEWNPQCHTETDPYKTLLVARLSYETNERKLRKVFEEFGTVKTVHLIQDKEGKSRGYAFIEYAKESDMKRAHRDADALKIDGRRIMVDVERGRTVKGWLPRRLGGGLGGTRIGHPKENRTYSGRDDPLKDEQAKSRAQSDAYDRAYGPISSRPRQDKPRDFDRPRQDRLRDYERPSDRGGFDRPRSGSDRPSSSSYDRPRDYDRPRQDRRDYDRPQYDRRDGRARSPRRNPRY